MGKSAQSARPTPHEQRQSEANSSYAEAAAAAFLRSATVTLVLQRPNVDIDVVTALYKAGFGDGCMYGATESRIAFERALAALAGGTPQ